VIKPEETAANPGLKQVAKICLNSLWGKFGQRSNLDSHEFIYDFNKLTMRMNDKKVTPKQWNIINEKCVELKYEDDNDMVIDANYISQPFLQHQTRE
jgi:hypothetical protein